MKSALMEKISHEILHFLLPHHRTKNIEKLFPKDFPIQLNQIEAFLKKDLPISFILPGFPCKSPNPDKVLGILPDMGEYLSLCFLNSLLKKIEKVYPPGAHLTLCSDGHIFGDLIRVSDEDIGAYADELKNIIERFELNNIALFDLRDILGDISHESKRNFVKEKYAPSLDGLRKEILSDEHALFLYRGITRFLFEDGSSYNISKSALQRSCRERAYEVIQRSRAFGDLIERLFPASLRLSIHPQPFSSSKFGIRLLEASDIWITPWHGVAYLRAKGNWTLLPRSEAAKHGKLIYQKGRASHFEEVLSH